VTLRRTAIGYRGQALTVLNLVLDMLPFVELLSDSGFDSKLGLVTHVAKALFILSFMKVLCRIFVATYSAFRHSVVQDS